MMCIIFILLFSMYEYNFLFVENNIILLYCFITQFFFFFIFVFFFLICTIKGETDHQPRLDAWDKRSDLVLWEDLEGAGGEGGGRGDRDGEDM